MIAASIAIAEIPIWQPKPSRGTGRMPHSLVEYMPDGVYPEGSTYWGYGAVFGITMPCWKVLSEEISDTVIIPDSRKVPSSRCCATLIRSWYYNFADCGDKGVNGDAILAWFASKTGNKAFEKNDF